MNSKKLRIAVITDLHYTKAAGHAPFPEVCALVNQVDPMEQLIEYIGNNSLEDVDLVLCPGDITTRACVESFSSGWSGLSVLAKKLNASHLIASTGNHEIISRSADINKIPGNVELHVDPQEHLLKMSDYPAVFSDDQKRWVYWGRGYEIISGKDWMVLVVNSCHYHSTQLANEFERGRVGEVALKELSDSLSVLAKDKTFRMVLIHHPPINHEEEGVELGREPMFNGIAFLRVLEETGLDWLVIHGHKHFQRLVRHSDSEYSPMIFGAGSFGASLKGAVATKTKNQFYIIDLETSLDALEQERLKAKFKSLYWNLSEWRPVQDETHGLPDNCGFDLGRKADVPKIARKIREAINDEQPWRTWDELKSEIEELKYLTPGDIRSLKKTLININIIYSPEQRCWFPSQVSIK